MIPASVNTLAKEETKARVINEVETSLAKEQKITIMRRGKRPHIPMLVYTDSKVTLSGCFVEKTKKQYTGLTLEEEKKYLPLMFDIKPEDYGNKEFNNRKVEFYASEIDITVPVTGIQLDGSLNEAGEPIDLFGFLQYKFALGHPKIAKDKAMLNSNDSYQTYVYDHIAEIKTLNNNAHYKRKAYALLGELDTEVKKNMVLVRFGTPYSKLDKLSNLEKENAIDTIITTKPAQFIDVVKDKDGEAKFLLGEMISKGILKRVKNSIINDTEVIGNSMEEAIIYMGNPKNAAVKQELTARLEGTSYKIDKVF